MNWHNSVHNNSTNTAGRTLDSLGQTLPLTYCLGCNEKGYALLSANDTRRIPDLATGGATKLTERLKAWWDLPDFAAFQAEVKKALKSKIPLKARNEWENWILAERTKVHALTGEIAQIEKEINAKVYALFDLTPAEIELLEANI